MSQSAALNGTSPTPPSGKPEDIDPSQLGTRTYWDKAYERELDNFRDTGDIGEIWFGSESVDKMIDWTIEHMDDKEAQVLDVGCGNGHLLFELASMGYKGLHGVDYSQPSIDLAKAIAEKREDHDAIRFFCADMFADAQGALQGPYDLILDKGTFDAISLNPEQKRRREEGEVGPVDLYAKVIASLLKEDGVLLITSCNWTQEELIRRFEEDLEYENHVKYPTFTFGGVTGQRITTVAFKKRRGAN